MGRPNLEMFDKKGQIKIIEAFLAVSIMFSVLALVAPPSSTSNFERQDALKKFGNQVLIKLDENGTLGELIEDANWTALEQSVEILLPFGVFFNLTVYNEQTQIVNTCGISNTNLSSLQGRETFSVRYLCATRSSEVHFYTVRLQLAWAE